MKVWVSLLVGTGAAVIIAAYAELVLDIRSQRSDLTVVRAVGARAGLSLVEYNKKLEQMQNAYGDRGHVILEGSTGKMTVTLDDRVIEESQIVREFASMYGLFVVRARDATESIFPFAFAFAPGEIPSDHEPNIGRLRSHFESVLPAKDLAFDDTDWTRDSCTVPQASDLGFGPFAAFLHLKSETLCMVH